MSSSSQHSASTIPIGRMGTWWFLAGEIVIFGGLIACYVLMRMRHPDWAEHASHTIENIGLFNTLVLLTSSLTIVQAFKEVDNQNYKKAFNLSWITIALGLVFLVVKAYEYTHEIQMGYTPFTNLFWSFYFFMTGLHGIHVIGGLIAIGVIAQGVKKGKNAHRIEYVGLYWHIVDIVWIFLFPLIYIAN